MNTAVPTASHPNPGMQVTTFENPMGIDGFEFVEFAAPAGRGQELHEYFRKMGFSAVLKHKQRPITVYRQGDVNFLVNEDPDSFAADFAEKHGPCACGFAIRFKKPGQEVYQTALGNGAEAIAFKPDSKAVNAPVIKGIGDCMLYLVDRYGSVGSVFDGDYEVIAGADLHPIGFGLTFIDHLTHNLYFGNMQQWSDYYERLFNFREIRYFDIKGLKTGLVSKAMTAPDGIVRIPLNESSDPKSQINEYLDAYKGEASCCRSSPRTASARSSSRSSSARATKASAKATSPRCLKASSATRSAAACCNVHRQRRAMPGGCSPVEPSHARLLSVPASRSRSHHVHRPHRPRLPVRFRQRIRHRGRRRRAAGRAELAAEGGPRPVCRTAVRHRVHRAARQQPPQLAVPHPPGGDPRRIHSVRAVAAAV